MSETGREGESERERFVRRETAVPRWNLMSRSKLVLYELYVKVKLVWQTCVQAWKPDGRWPKKARSGIARRFSVTWCVAHCDTRISR